MLVLSRKRNERVMIGDDIVVTIVDVRGDKVRLGFEAPPAVRIMRSELLPFDERPAAAAPLASDLPANAADPTASAAAE